MVSGTWTLGGAQHSTYLAACDDDDIYIMTKCLSVTKNDHFRAERRRREVSRPQGLAGLGLVMMMTMMEDARATRSSYGRSTTISMGLASVFCLNSI